MAEPTKSSSLTDALPWVAALVGVGGLAYAVTRPEAKPAGSPAKAPKRRKKGSKRGKKASAEAPAEPKAAPGPYARFVQAQMPALMKKGMSAPDAMRRNGREADASSSKARSISSNIRT